MNFFLFGGPTSFFCPMRPQIYCGKALLNYLNLTRRLSDKMANKSGDKLWDHINSYARTSICLKHSSGWTVCSRTSSTRPPSHTKFAPRKLNSNSPNFSPPRSDNSTYVGQIKTACENNIPVSLYYLCLWNLFQDPTILHTWNKYNISTSLTLLYEIGGMKRVQILIPRIRFSVCTCKHCYFIICYNISRQKREL